MDPSITMAELRGILAALGHDPDAPEVKAAVYEALAEIAEARAAAVAHVALEQALVREWTRDRREAAVASAAFAALENPHAVLDDLRTYRWFRKAIDTPVE